MPQIWLACTCCRLSFQVNIVCLPLQRSALQAVPLTEATDSTKSILTHAHQHMHRQTLSLGCNRLTISKKGMPCHVWLHDKTTQWHKKQLCCCVLLSLLKNKQQLQWQIKQHQITVCDHTSKKLLGRLKRLRLFFHWSTDVQGSCLVP